MVRLDNKEKRSGIMKTYKIVFSASLMLALVLLPSCGGYSTKDLEKAVAENITETYPISISGIKLVKTSKTEYIGVLSVIDGDTPRHYEIFVDCDGKKFEWELGDIISAEDAYAFIEEYSDTGNLKSSPSASGNYTQITDFKYDLTKDGSGVAILKYTGSSSIVSVPPEIEGYPVIEIGKEAFFVPSFESSTVSFITLPYGIKIIGEAAFCNANIETITIPDTVIEIGAGAFYGSKLFNISIPSSVKKIGYAAFSHCQGLEFVTIPDTVIEIEGGLFKGDLNLKAVIISNNITEFGLNFFEDCISLESVNFPKKLQQIDSTAFRGCKNLNEIIIPPEIQKINFESGVFRNIWTSLSLATRKKLQDLGYQP